MLTNEEEQHDLSESQVRERLVTDLHADALPIDIHPDTMCTICQHKVALSGDSQVTASHTDEL